MSFLFCPQVKLVFWEGGGLLGTHQLKKKTQHLCHTVSWNYYFISELTLHDPQHSWSCCVTLSAVTVTLYHRQTEQRPR